MDRPTLFLQIYSIHVPLDTVCSNMSWIYWATALKFKDCLSQRWFLANLCGFCLWGLSGLTPIWICCCYKSLNRIILRPRSKRTHEVDNSAEMFSGYAHTAMVVNRAWPIHRQHSPSGPIVGQSETSEPSANDDNRWLVRADVSRWRYSLNSPSHELYRPPVQNYSRSHAVYVFDDCSSAEGGNSIMEVNLSEMRPGQQPMQYFSSFEGVSDQAVLLLPCWTNNHCSRPGLNVVIEHYWPFLPPPL